MSALFTRTLQMLVLPPASILLLMLLGFLLVWSHRILGRLLVAAGFLLLYGLSLNPVSDLLIAPLEEGYRPVDTRIVKADVIVVLGGGARGLPRLGLEPEPGEKSLQRLVAALKLHRSLHIPIVCTGGPGDPAQPQVSDSLVMARTLMELGIPKDQVRVDAASPNTIASARAMKQLLAGKRIILVTSAFHLKRALALFRAQGLDVIPEPCGYLSGQLDRSFYAFIPRMDYLSTSTTALSERIAYAWYWITLAV